MKRTIMLLCSVLIMVHIQAQESPQPVRTIKSNAQIKLPPTTVTVDDITEWLCPKKLIRGDREFDGNGPLIKAEVKLRLAANGRELWADISFNAKETKHDWSETEGRWSKKIYDAPYGKKIKTIVSDKASRTKFVSPKAGFQFLVPGADVAPVLNVFFANEPVSSLVLTAHGIPAGNKERLSKLITGRVLQGNTVVRVPAVEGGLVKFFHIVGDTGGEDISNDDNCNDDTRIVKIEFFPVKLEFENEK